MSRLHFGVADSLHRLYIFGCNDTIMHDITEEIDLWNTSDSLGECVGGEWHESFEAGGNAGPVVVDLFE